MDSRVVTFAPTILLIGLVAMTTFMPGGVEWSVIVLLVVAQVVWGVLRFVGWTKGVVESAAGNE